MEEATQMQKQKCKKCGSVSVAYDPVRAEWRCLWNSCRHVVAEKAPANGTQRRERQSAGGAPKTSQTVRPAARYQTA